MLTKANIAVLVSGGGTNLQALLDAQARGTLQNGSIAAVLSSRPDAYALERARAAGVEAQVVDFFAAALRCARFGLYFALMEEMERSNSARCVCTASVS